MQPWCACVLFCQPLFALHIKLRKVFLCLISQSFVLWGFVITHQWVLFHPILMIVLHLLLFSFGCSFKDVMWLLTTRAILRGLECLSQFVDFFWFWCESQSFSCLWLVVPFPVFYKKSDPVRMRHCRVEDKFLAMLFMTKTCRCT
jgi:hypothetical protein